MKRLIVLAIMAFVSLNLFGHSKSYRGVGANRLNKEMTANKKSFQILDVYTDKEFKKSAS